MDTHDLRTHLGVLRKPRKAPAPRGSVASALQMTIGENKKRTIVPQHPTSLAHSACSGQRQVSFASPSQNHCPPPGKRLGIPVFGSRGIGEGEVSVGVNGLRVEVGPLPVLRAAGRFATLATWN